MSCGGVFYRVSYRFCFRCDIATNHRLWHDLHVDVFTEMLIYGNMAFCIYAFTEMLVYRNMDLCILSLLLLTGLSHLLIFSRPSVILDASQ